jgi:hypothetical protein
VNQTGGNQPHPADATCQAKSLADSGRGEYPQLWRLHGEG